MLIELFGYLGSALVVISMLMSSVVKLRIINVAGSIISGTYALIIGSFPLALMNICLIIINSYNLFKLLKTKQVYELVDGNAEDASVAYFLNHYQDDIKVYFPNFLGSKDWDVVYMVYCNAAPAGLFLGKSKGNGEIALALDYTTPAYRDCSVGAFLYEKLTEKGIKKLSFANPSEKHVPYLTKMGYIFEEGAYTKNMK